MRLWLWIAAAAMLAAAVTPSAAAGEVTGASDNLRTGWYPDEPSLSGQVAAGKFKQAFENKELKGQIYAQPLVANGTLLVVTEENNAYGLDPVTGQVRWTKSFGAAVKAGPEGSKETIECEDLAPRVGITGTPVIDTEHNVAYFTSNSYLKGESGSTGWFMNAISLSTGEQQPGFPVPIEGKSDNLEGNANFEPVQQLQRPALLMMNGVVYAAFGSHCDRVPYEGWIVGVSTSGGVVTKWATTPSGHGAAIWQSGTGLMSDGSGQIVFGTGNGMVEAGVWDPAIGATPAEAEGKLGESVARVQVQAGGHLKTTDFFSPFSDKELDEKDLDIGSSAPVGLPSPYFGNGGAPNLLVQEGKQGVAYVLNRDALGGREKEKNHVVQEIKGASEVGVWGAAGVWPGEKVIAFPRSHGHLLFYKYSTETGQFTQSAKSLDEMEFGSGSPVVTSNGATGGSALLWINWCPVTTKCAKGELRAYNPGSAGEPKPLVHEPIGAVTKFSRPVASNGHIYVGNNEGHLIGFSGPVLTPSRESVSLAATVGSEATGEVTLTNTGSELEVKSITVPGSPFQVTAVPAAPVKLKPGQEIKLHVTFRPTAPGPAGGQISVVSDAGETRIALAGAGEESSAERAAREARERAAASTTPVGLVTPPPGAGVHEPLVVLTKLSIRAKASRLSARRRKLALSYTVSAAGYVEFVISRRVLSRHCRAGVARCFRWVPTRVKRRVSARAGANGVVLNLGTLAAGTYRVSAAPINRSGVRGAVRTLQFRTRK